MTKLEALHDAGKFIIKVIFILILSLILFFVFAVSVFLVVDAISFRSSQSEGYKIAQKLVKSKKLTKMNYDEVIELLNDYHEECKDFADYIYETDNYDGDGSYIYIIKCHGGSAYAGGGPITDYIFCVTFDENKNFQSVGHYYIP